MKRLRLVGTKTAMKAGTAYKIGTVPNGYFPQTGFVGYAVMAASTTATFISKLEIDSSTGVVTVTPYADRAANAQIYIDVTYN